MANWKLAFLCDAKTITTSGEQGKVNCYDIDTLENTGVYNSLDIFSTAIANVIKKKIFIITKFKY